VLPSTDRGNKLTCRKTFCEIHSKQRKENSRRGPFLWKKQAYQTGTSEVEPPMWPSSKLGMCSGSEEEGVGGET